MAVKKQIKKTYYFVSIAQEMFHRHSYLGHFDVRTKPFATWAFFSSITFLDYKKQN